jgi:hypothetical protein
MLQQQQEKINKITPTVRAASPVAPAVPNRGDILQHRGQSTVENAKFQSSAKFAASTKLTRNFVKLGKVVGGKRSTQ